MWKLLPGAIFVVLAYVVATTHQPGPNGLYMSVYLALFFAAIVALAIPIAFWFLKAIRTTSLPSQRGFILAGIVVALTGSVLIVYFLSK